MNNHAYSERHYLDTTTMTTTGQEQQVQQFKPHIMTIATPPETPEVTRLETGRQAIFEGFRRGFARAYDCLVVDPKERGRGSQVALEYFPDEILDYDPIALLLQEEENEENKENDNNEQQDKEQESKEQQNNNNNKQQDEDDYEEVSSSSSSSFPSPRPSSSQEQEQQQELGSDDDSAFSVYMRKYGITPKAWSNKQQQQQQESQTESSLPLSSSPNESDKEKQDPNEVEMVVNGKPLLQ